MYLEKWKSPVILVMGAFTLFSSLVSGEPEINTVLLYDSKYVSEGRDYLGEGGMPSAELVVAFEKVTLGAWYARGDSVDYDELDMGIEYGFNLGAFEAYVCYTRLEFMMDDESDDELGVGIAREVPSGFVMAVDYVYSLEADGAFVELSVSREFEIEDTNLSVWVYALEGFDFGYASAEYDGPNNFQVGLYLQYALNDTASLMAGASNSWAHGDVRRNGLGDVAWASVGLEATF